jgi:hypothetical protein
VRHDNFCYRAHFEDDLCQQVVKCTAITDSHRAKTPNAPALGRTIRKPGLRCREKVVCPLYSQFLLRFPDEAMRDRITLLAIANGRSVNAEIIDRLQRSIIDTIPVDDAIAELYDRVEKLENRVRDLEDDR